MIEDFAIIRPESDSRSAQRRWLKTSVEVLLVCRWRYWLGALHNGLCGPDTFLVKNTSVIFSFVKCVDSSHATEGALQVVYECSGCEGIGSIGSDARPEEDVMVNR
jgi:hypothetical protein